jgi:hypothetical protein
MNRLPDQKLYQLLGTSMLPGTPQQLEKLFVRLSELAAINGEEWIRRNRSELLAQWEAAVRAGMVG